MGLFSEHPSPCSPATGALGKTWDRERNAVNRSVLRKLGTGAQAKGKAAVESEQMWDLLRAHNLRGSRPSILHVDVELGVSLRRFHSGLWGGS